MIAYPTKTQVLRRLPRTSALAALAVALVASVSPVSVAAQDSTDARLRKVEKEVSALQRKVFPGGSGTFFEPQITAPAAGSPAPQTATSTPVSDLLNRMEAVESQMARLTSQVEQNSNRLALLEEKVAASASVPAAPAPQSAPQAEPVSASQNNLSAMSGGVIKTPPAAAAKPAPAQPAPAQPAPATSARAQGVQAIVKPQTADAGEDEYTYGFRLWDAGYFPEARQQLKIYLEKYPNHRMASYGRNLLGRAWLDDKNPSEAAKWFLQNYQADKQGARAADSLLYLGIAMKQLKDTKRACIALAEFSETYASEAAGRLGSLYSTTRNGLDCN
ncbi:MAG: hypothetical protein VYD90_02435 [Pseudomonadota bacterium]|uniref:tetratricopeptide repeat protein n=1 Tax=Novosphingobium sp. MBES04 TaxID=1206458 RepID=UPI000693639E|nr:hypothetical protein [Novosphingobium sp. MBES04]MED5544086.1 hypothetical protein [Pseudomonadota bacterium]GAM05630.1 hypothetical conserved protein [Novosphingobium sp. MBES04]